MPLQCLHVARKQTAASPFQLWLCKHTCVVRLKLSGSRPAPPPHGPWHVPAVSHSPTQSTGGQGSVLVQWIASLTEGYSTQANRKLSVVQIQIVDACLWILGTVQTQSHHLATHISNGRNPMALRAQKGGPFYFLLLTHTLHCMQKISLGATLRATKLQLCSGVAVVSQWCCRGVAHLVALMYRTAATGELMHAPDRAVAVLA